MRELRTPGSVRGVLGNGHPYRDHAPALAGGHVRTHRSVNSAKHQKQLNTSKALESVRFELSLKENTGGFGRRGDARRDVRPSDRPLFCGPLRLPRSMWSPRG